MVAVFNVMFDFGGTDANPGTQQIVDSLGPPMVRWKTNDDATIDAIDPCIIPSGADTHSYWKHIYLKCTTAPSTQVNNVKFYTDGGGYGTGIILYVGDEMPTKNSGASTGYEVADGTPGTTGTELVVGHSVITAKTDAFVTYTSGSAKTVSISETSSLINAIGETTNYLVFQLTIANTASPGDLDNETLTFQYDEI